jgi:hypothetical protein
MLDLVFWQGFPSNESDDEWDAGIAREYGRHYHWGVHEHCQMDAGINTMDVVQHAFHVYDTVDAGEGPGETLPSDGSIDGHHSHERARSAEGGAGCAAVCKNEELDDDAVQPNVMALGASQAFLEDSATTPLFANAQLSTMSATLLILNCLRIRGANNTLISELFTLLSKSVLPAINSLLSTEYAASKMLRQLGLSYELIHACSGGCVLFRGVENESLTECLKSNKPRFKRVGKSFVPSEVLRYFPLIPWLQRLYSTPAMAALMTWHWEGRSRDGMIWHVVDALQ